MHRLRHLLRVLPASALFLIACASPPGRPAAPIPCPVASPAATAPAAEARVTPPPLDAGAVADPESHACTAQPVTGLPATPAGEAFAAWLGAFDSGDRACLAAYAAKYEKTLDVDEDMEFYGDTGGFDVAEVVKSAPSRLIARVKERSGHREAVARVGLASESPAVVKVREFQVLRPGDVIDDVAVDGSSRATLVKEAAAHIRRDYVLPDVGERMAQAIEQRNASHGYDAAADPDELARMLMKDLRDVSHDAHVATHYSVTKLRKRDAKAEGPAEKARSAAALRSRNCGFDRVERLPGNIGYLKFDEFSPPDVCAPTAEAAMAFVADTDAIVFDVRENGGGDPKQLVVLASYLFRDRTHLNDIYDRPKNKTQEYWTNVNFPGKKSDDKPVYVLTSRRTFSCAEEFAYDLKALKRATLVGETTGGGAHPVDFVSLDDHFALILPIARAINPITKTNWEGVGVEPDVKVAAKDALDRAVELAKDAMKERKRP